MNVQILQGHDSRAIRRYVGGKFKKFAGPFYPKSARDRKCIEYWIAADGNEPAQRAIEGAYQDYFKQLFPLEKAEAELERRHQSPQKYESSEWHHAQEVRLVRMENTLGQLNQWKEEGDYQEGEDFFLRLQQATEFVSSDLCDDVQYASEYEAARQAALTTSTTVGPRSAQAEFDAILGFRQRAALSFSAYSMDWGEINAKLEQSLTAGIWGRGKAKAEMAGLGFSAEVQAAIAMGGEFDLSGECTWRKGAAGLKLDGNCQLFVGAKASGSASLSASVKGKLNAAFQAEAFVGFEAKVSGKCAFTYEGTELVAVTASAGISFGAGGGCMFRVSADIFGPTTVEFGVSAALGLGTSTETAVAINFTEIYLAGATEFRKIVYLPTLARGYRMDLMNQELKNRVYLDKCIARFGDEISGLEETLASFQRTPMEKRPLLMA